jgi:hypothetical protein
MLIVKHRVFESATKSWDALCAEAAAFATEIGKYALINISVAAAGGQDFLGAGATGVIIVWYWDFR